MSVCACNVKFSNCLWIKFPNYVSKACWWLIMGSADNAPFITQLWKLLVTNSMVERSCTTFYIHYIVDQHLIAFYVWLKISLITNEHTPRRVAARTHTPNIWDTWTNLLRSPFLAADFTCFLADSAVRAVRGRRVWARLTPPITASCSKSSDWLGQAVQRWKFKVLNIGRK